MTSVIHINFQVSLFMPRLVIQLNAWSRTRSSSEFWGLMTSTICPWDYFHKNTDMVLWILLLLTFDWIQHSNLAIDGITNLSQIKSCRQLDFPMAACLVWFSMPAKSIKWLLGSLLGVPFPKGWRIAWEILCPPLSVDKHALPQLACPSLHKHQA